MFYLGIDIGKFNHAAALMNQRGKVIATLSSFPNTYSGFQTLLALISSALCRLEWVTTEKGSNAKTRTEV